MMRAIAEGDIEAAKSLLGANCDPNERLQGAERNEFAGFLKLLTFTFLFAAAQCGTKEIARLLLDAGARVDVGSSLHNEAPLIVAVDQGFVAIVELLLERGANINLKTGQGVSAGWVGAQDSGGEPCHLPPRPFRFSCRRLRYM